MKEKIKVWKAGAWILICFWFFRPILFRLIHIDFNSVEISKIYQKTWIILVVISIIVIAVDSWKKLHYWVKVKRAILLGGGICILIGLNVFFNVCEWSFPITKYKHKYEEYSIQIRVLDCGAWDSSPSRVLVKTMPIGKYLTYYSEIEEEDVNLREWVKVSNLSKN